jgi:hypothetical protein
LLLVVAVEALILIQVLSDPVLVVVVVLVDLGQELIFR